MRVRIVFGLVNKGSNVPFHHQYLLSGFIDSVLGAQGSPYKNYPFYHFSGLKGQIKVGKDGLYFYSSKVTLVFSSSEKDLVDYFLQKLFLMPQVQIGNLLLVPQSVEKENMPQPNSEMKYLLISPLVVTDPNEQEDDPKRFISPLSDEFSDLLYESTILRMEEHGYTSEELEKYFKFQIIPDKGYLNKIKNDDKKFARVFPVFYGDERIEVRGYTFPFTLYAHEDVQKFVLENGLGYCANKGFGMLDIANSDPNLRIESYMIPGA